MKKTFFKSLFRGIKQNFGRFISIIAIVALGVGFLIGLLSTTPDLQYSVSKYYSESNVYDVNLVSTIGFSENNVSFLESKYSEIADIKGIHQEDKKTIVNGQEVVSRIYYVSLINEDVINKKTLEKGNLPTNKNECVVERSDGYLIDVNIGDQIKDGDKVFTISGIVSSPAYFQKGKETTNIGNGRLGSIVYFDSSFYEDEDLVITNIYMTLKENKKNKANYFDSKYIDYVDAFSKKVKEDKTSMLKLRVDEIRDESYKEAYDEVYSTIYKEYEKNIRAQLEAMGLKGELLEAQLKAIIETKLSEIKVKAEEETTKAVNEVIDEIDKEIYVLNLSNSNISYITFKMNAQKVADVSVIFPAFFFLIAALVSLTSITRMIEEERTSIGTLKALGYHRGAIMWKYLFYALAACGIGSLVGLACGIFILPYVIYQAYFTLYFLPALVFRYEFLIITISILAMILLIVLVTYLVCFSTLRERPSTLLLGKSPKPGKKILLERVKFFWKHLSFKNKSMFKNIFRYKKNFFVMVVGIGGCTALLLIGFGLKDSIGVVSNYQYDNLLKYELVVSVDKFNDSIFDDISEVNKFQKAYYNNEITCTKGEDKISSYIVAMDNKTDNSLDSYVSLEGVDGKVIEFSKDKIYITKQISEYLHLTSGDTFTIDIDGNKKDIKVDYIVQNYVNNYIYMDIENFNKNVDSKAKMNSYLVISDKLSLEKQDIITNRLIDKDEVVGVEIISQTKSTYDFLFKNMNYIILVLILFSGALSMVVTYNLTNININERIREIATLKVLGYQRHEVAGYVYRETMVLTIIGSGFGLLIGYFLHKFIINIVNNEGLTLGANMNPLSYLYAFGISIVFAILVDIIFLPKLKKIKMVESLKCVD